MTYGTVLADTLQTSSGQILGAGNATGFKNKLINGNFNINQRAVSGTVTLSAGAYGHDRWKAGSSGCTYTFSTTANVTTLTISAGSLQQVIEGVNLQSGTYVLSWTGTAQGRIASGSYGSSGSVTASITGGTDTTIEFNTGTLSLTQLEIGSIASSFEFRDYGRELILCQRYYQSIAYPRTFMSVSGATAFYSPVYYVVSMRTAPTITLPSSSGNVVLNSSETPTTPGYQWNASNITTNSFSLRGGTANIGGIVEGIATASAEL